MSRSERILLWSTAAITLALRAVAFFRYRFDSDEQQHLHVTWGWTAGLVQYRDLFDNHAPLFHMITAPILAMFGEREDILLWMRLPMLVLFGVIVWATWDLGKRLYDERVAAWAVVLLMLFPPFFLKSLEFRTDNLWVALWMLVVVGLVRGWRPFVIGLLFGLAFAVSLKTMLLVIAVVVARVMMVSPRAQSRDPLHDGDPSTALGMTRALLAFLIVPAALAIYFIAAGAWDELLYCNFTFNSQLALMRKNLWIPRAIFPFTAAAVLWMAWRTRRSEHPWRWFLAVVVGVFTVTIAGFWILISPRDFLPLMPLVAIFAAAELTRARRPLAWITATVLVMLFALYRYADRFQNNTAEDITMVRQALRLTRPGEMLMDIKGETVYRRRPFYPIFEYITRAQMARGLIRDTVAADVIRTRTYVAQADGPLWPPTARAFLSDNFVNLGRLRAAGQWLKPDGTFTIAIPGEYVILDERGEAHGVLDGSPYIRPRLLAAGAHRFLGEQGTCVVWAEAYRRGHSPFHLRDLDF